MKSDLPKVLVPVAGRPMVEFVLDMLDACDVGRVVAVVGYRSDLVRRALANRRGLIFVEQTEQRGTGHAVMVCRDELAGFDGPVVIVTGDSPLVRPATIDALLKEFNRSRPACLLGTAYKDDPRGLGRIVRDERRRFLGIVEEKDATEEQRKITEVNMSCYVFNAADLLWALDRLKADNAQKEYYLTDCPGLLLEAGKPVEALPLLSPAETLSINTPDELAAVETALAKKE
jgi:bifunctional UDP-N-acetylglucosamine pyrophosphorylase/glucosamine-1-phosphate N-acetyltransferase/UDP-N-acetylglucosamine pyrophosphorylase